MGHEYALDWLDEMVNDLDPLRTEPESLDNYQSTSIIDKAGQEEKRLITLFREIAFQERKPRQIRKLFNSYLSAAVSLMKLANKNLKLTPSDAGNFRSALESILSCLRGLTAFIANRYRSYVDRDLSLNMVDVDPGAHDLRKLASRDVMKVNRILSELVIGSFSDIFFDNKGGEITMRKFDYWVSVSHAVTFSSDLVVVSETFDRLELIMIERNFNSPLFIKYLTTKFLIQLDNVGDSSSVVQRLAFLQKTFNQIPVMKGIIFSDHYDDLSLTINSWFIQEIDFLSKKAGPASSALNEVSAKKGNKYDRKTSDKILCHLTVDQLSLFFKAADLTNIISARSLSAIFQTVAPYLSTPHCTDISNNSLRVKSYTAEERDKTLLIDVMSKLIRQIQDL